MACGEERAREISCPDPDESDRVDVEVIGPSETMDLETECGSGLCQQLAETSCSTATWRITTLRACGGYWRVYNTIQQGANHNDVMPDLLSCRTARAASRWV